MGHEGRKDLRKDFADVWRSLDVRGVQGLETSGGKAFRPFASHATRGSREGEKVIIIKKGGKEFARIYPCCWGYQTNCYGTRSGTRIGGYSDALDEWACSGDL